MEAPYATRHRKAAPLSAIWSLLGGRSRKSHKSDYKHVIDRQSLLIDLSRSVLAESEQGKAVARLVCTAKDIVNCDRIGFFVAEPGRGLVCQASPGGGEAGWVVEPGRGIVGQVALHGRTVNVVSVQKDPHFDQHIDGGRCAQAAQSILCVGLKDGGGEVVAVMEAINKRGLGDGGASGKQVCGKFGIVPVEPQAITAFDDTDEEMLRLLLALTNQQLRVLALEEHKARATRQAESLLTLVGSLSTTITDVDACLRNLAEATRSQLGCQQVSIFLTQGGELVCRACSPQISGPMLYQTWQIGAEDSCVLTAVIRSGDAATYEHTNTAALEALARVLNGNGQSEDKRPTVRPMSAVISPLKANQDIFGVVVAVNKVLELPDGDMHTASERGGGAMHRRLSQLLRDEKSRMPHRTLTRPPTDGIGVFTPMHLKRLDVMLSFAAHAVLTAELYRRQQLSNSRLRALLCLCTDSVHGLQRGDLQDVIFAVCRHGEEVFHCTRVCFYAVDPLTDELLAWFVEQDELKRKRSPRTGIVGHVVNTGQAVNISNAWADPRFCREEDLRTGCRTHNLLCHPIVARSGCVIAALECVNEISGRPFDTEDEHAFNVLTAMFADMVHTNMSETSMLSMMEGEDLHPDVKEAIQAMRIYTPARSMRSSCSSVVSRGVTVETTGSLLEMGQRTDKPRTRTVPPCIESTPRQIQLLSWDLDYFDIGGGAGALNVQNLTAWIPEGFEYFGLCRGLNIMKGALQTFAGSIAREYRPVPYHNFMHAFVTFHLVFLMVGQLIVDLKKNSGGGLDLPYIDRFALLIAALGHDADHRGFSNGFETVTESDLAIFYNDISPLENHHASVTWQHIKSSRPSLTETLPVEKVKRLRAVIIHCILRSDIAKHNDHVVWLRSTTPREHGDAEGDVPVTDFSKDLASSLLHCADIGHPSLQWCLHKRFSLLACQELFNQFREETLRGLPTLPFMGKDPEGPLKEIGPSQAGFVGFVCVPVWHALNTFSGGVFQDAVNRMQGNKQKWERVDELDAEEPEVVVRRTITRTKSEDWQSGRPSF